MSRRAIGGRAWVVLAAAAPLFALALAARLTPRFDFNGWDNHEYYTPLITSAHGHWLRGTFPEWNDHQAMGEPLHAAMQCAALYLPHTLCTLIVRVAGWPLSAFPAVSVALHSVLGAAGWYLLLRALSVRPSLAFVGATGASVCGFFSLLSTVWVFTAAILAWLPWTLLGSVRILGEAGRARGAALLVVGLTAIVTIGHPQLAVYSWLFVALFVALYAVFVLRRPARLLACAGAFAIAVMTSAPFWLPAARFLSITPRADALSRAAFLERSARPSVLLDLLLPLYRSENGFLHNRHSVVLHGGAWVVTAIAGALAIGGIGRAARARAGGEPAPDDAPLRGSLLFSLAIGGLFFVLALGENGFVLPLTHGIPVWSSFRWPFKFLAFAGAAFGLAGALALETCARAGEADTAGEAARAEEAARGGGASRAAIASRAARFAPWTGALIVAVALVLLAPDHLRDSIEHAAPLRTPSGVLSLAASLAGLVLGPLVGRAWARGALAVAAPLGAAALFGLCQQEPLKPYDEPLGSVSAADLGIDTRYRVLPLSMFEYSPAVRADEYGVNYSATLNGYDSVTGPRTEGMAARWYLHLLPSDVFGLLAPDVNAQLIGTNLLRSFNARYVIVAKEDVAQVELLARRADYRLARELRDVCVYEDSLALPRAYFATEIRPASDEALLAGLGLNAAAATTAFVEGCERAEPFTRGEVLDAEWRGGRVRIAIAAAGAGFLVVSTTDYPGWSATIDGAPASIRRVNGTLMGVAVPAGAAEIELRYRTPGLVAGFATAGAGLAILFAWGAAVERDGRSAQRARFARYGPTRPGPATAREA